MKQKEFFIIFEGQSLKQMKKLFLEGESPTWTTSFGGRNEETQRF